MSQYLSDNSLSSAEEKIDISEEAEVFVFPTSFAQARLWFLDQLAPENSSYNVATAIRFTGSLNLTALEQAFNAIVSRHETLRTTFVMVGQPMQVIAPTLTIPLPVIDLRHLSATEREIQARQLATQEAQRPFHLNTAPLLRVKLLQLDSAEYVLLLNLHHIVADGWSIGVLIRELGTLYTAYRDDVCNISTLPQLPIQYADFAEWQREWLQGLKADCSPLQTQLAYWKKQLDGVSVLNLPTDRIRPAVPSYKGAKQFLELPQSLSEKLQTLSQQEGVTLFMTLLAAFQTLLYRYTQQEDIAVGSPIANRNRSEIEGLIGFFVNSLVMRTNLSGNPTFRELLLRVREVTLGAYAHQDLPFEKLVEELQKERDLSHHPLFQVVFSLQNTPIKALELPGLSLSLFEFDSQTAKFDLEFHLWELDSIKGEAVYSTDLFDDSTITRMLGNFQTLLESIVAHPEQRLSDLAILTQAERYQLLVEFNQNQDKIATADTKKHTQINTYKTDNDSPSAIKCGLESNIPLCHQLFEAQVEQNPNAVAVVFENQHLTYRELNNQANQLAHYLQQLGVAPEILVGICVERSVEMIVGLLGILKAGGAYLPLDPSYPQERLSFMLQDAQISILLTHSAQVSLFQESHRVGCVSQLEASGVNWGEQQSSLSIICIDKDWQTITQHSQKNPISGVTSDNLAYVIYTSGSTGKPKGVLIEHRGVYNLAQAQIETFNIRAGGWGNQSSNRILQFASLSFDASVFEIVMALGTGGTLCLANKEALLPGQSLIELLQKQAITHVTLPPAVLAVLPEAELPALQTIICAGDSCTDDIVKRWLVSGRRFFNAYGPTEATVWSTIAEVKNSGGKLSIGRPITNTQIYILDKNLQPVPIGIVGELYIGGEGLARGYLNRFELTAERFIPNPFSEASTTKNEIKFSPLSIFKTGDLARYQPDGNIQFIGRIDNQVKVRGFRIEVSEIEAVLNQHQGVQETAVIAKENISGDKSLVAYIIPNQRQTPTTIELRKFLQEKLPKYMVPNTFVVLDSLPLTANGKVDYHALSTFDILTHRSTDTFVSPRTAIESTLAKIWIETLDTTSLHLENISIYDNFFELGGNSLLAVRLIEQTHKQFERKLPLSSLFLNPTIESLAKLLSQKDSVSWSPLVAIQPTGSNPPFFCVHPIFGVTLPYYELAHHLGKNQPFYALQPLGLDGETPLTRIEDMATYYIEAMRTVQPSGPYFLGGWSFGGLVAFEMAQQLHKAGHEVALLAVLDTVAPVSGYQYSISDSFQFLFTTVARYIWSFFLDYFYLMTTFNENRVNSFISRFPYFQKFLQWLKTNLFSRFNLEELTLATFMSQESKSQILHELAISPMLRVFHANSQAVVNYIPQAYPNQITLFRTNFPSKTANQNPSLGWDKLGLGGVKVHQVPGNHLTMLKKPHVQILAEQLRVCIENKLL